MLSRPASGYQTSGSEISNKKACMLESRETNVGLHGRRHVIHGSFNLVASLLKGALLRIRLHGRRGLVGERLARGVGHVVKLI